MARQSWGKSEHSDWFFLGPDFALWTISMETGVSYAFFVFEKQENLINNHGLSAM